MKLRVLVADDDEDVILICRAHLEFRGHEVLAASDSRQALSLAVSECPDVMVLDVMFPGPDGLQVLQELKRRPETRAIPVILLSARVRAEDVIAGFERGAADYAKKPFAPVAFADLVERIAAADEEELAAARERRMTELEQLPYPTRRSPTGEALKRRADDSGAA